LDFIARCGHPDLPAANHRIIAQFVAPRFRRCGLGVVGDDSGTKTDLIEAAVACAPTWWK